MVFLKKFSNYDKLAEELGIGAITLQDIVKELENRRVIRVRICQNLSCAAMSLR